MRLYDVGRGGAPLRSFEGHHALVSRAVFSPHGKLLITGSKDTTIRNGPHTCLDTCLGSLATCSPTVDCAHRPVGCSLSGIWDLTSGVCIQTLKKHLGEVSSVEMNAAGTLLLSSSKDNSHRLWDVRMMRPHLRLTLKGHRNTTKNFGRASFGPTHSVGAATDPAGTGASRQRIRLSSLGSCLKARLVAGGREGLVVGGSEDGLVYLWDLGSGRVLSRLRGHTDVVRAHGQQFVHLSPEPEDACRVRCITSSGTNTSRS